MSDESLYTDVAKELMDEVRDLREDTSRFPAREFMHEYVRPDRLMDRTRKMTPGERKQLREELGDDAILSMLRRHGGRNG